MCILIKKKKKRRNKKLCSSLSVPCYAPNSIETYKKGYENSEYQFWGRTYRRFTHDNEELHYNTPIMLCVLGFLFSHIQTERDRGRDRERDAASQTITIKIWRKKRTILLTVCVRLCLITTYRSHSYIHNTENEHGQPTYSVPKQNKRDRKNAQSWLA